MPRRNKIAISRDTTVAAVENQVSCTVGDEAVILHLKNGAYYGLNAVGAAVWNLIQKPKTVAELREAVAQEFDVSAAECEKDILDLLGNLANAGLIEVRDGNVG